MLRSIGTSHYPGKLGWLLALAAAIAIHPACPAGREDAGAGAERGERPSVVLVTIDSLRADHVGYAGHARSATPNIDALAARSFRFRQAQTPSPLSTPSLASLLTGKYPARIGVRLNKRDALPSFETTISEALGQEGYATAAVVGSLLLHPKYGLDQGFDEYMESFAKIPRPREAPVVGILATRVVDKALEWLETAHTGDFFLWVNLHDPHYFYAPPAPFATDFEDSPYDGEIAYADRELGRLLDRLVEYGVDDKTLIILAGNHGEGLTDHGEAYHGTLLYQSTLHVPLLVKPAGAVPPDGADVDTPVSLVDLMPTILDLAGSGSRPEMDGRSLAPLLKQGASAGMDPERVHFAETIQPSELFGWAPQAAVRSGDWKYIRSTTGRLFNLADDPAETTDLSSAHPEIVSRLEMEIDRLFVPPSVSCEPCASMVGDLGLAWPGEIGPSGRDIDPLERIALANDVLKANRTLERKMVESAELIYKDVVSRDPENRLALIDLGLITGLRQDLDGAQRMLGKAQKLYAADAEIYHVLGHMALVEPPDQERATALFRVAALLDPLNEEALYDAACGVALTGDKDLALDLLARSVQAGFKDFRHMSRDTDLDSIREDDRFRTLMPEPRAKSKGKAAAEQASEE